MTNAHIYIERMKRAHRVTTDEQLAEKLGKAKQTVASWRVRDAIPDKIITHMTKNFGLNFVSVEGTYEESEFNHDNCIKAATMSVFANFIGANNWSGRELLAIGTAYDAVEEAIEGMVLSIPIEKGLYIDDRLEWFLDNFDPKDTVFKKIIKLMMEDHVVPQ